MASGLYIQTPKNPKKVALGWLVIAVLIVTILACGWYLYRWYTTGDEPPIPLPKTATADASVDESDITPVQKAEYSVPATHPRYISIPSLGISNTRVIPIGLAKDNLLDSPANINDAGWYKNSATPGSGGAVLIDGHNGGVRKDGVFSKIGTLAKGADITIERGDGQRLTYTVVENQSMELTQVNNGGMKTMMQSAEVGKEGLSLITCDGKWVPQYRQYDHRIMLRAVLKS